MIGKLLSTATKVVTLPIDAASITVDLLLGGDGSKQSRTGELPFGVLEDLRDKITETMEEIDKP